MSRAGLPHHVPVATLRTRPAYSFLQHLTTLRACAQRGRTARQMAKDESIQALFAELGNGARLSSYDFRCT